MVGWILKKILGSRNQRVLRKMWPLVRRVNEIEEKLQTLSDAEIRAKTDEFRQRLQNGETLDDLMCETYAVVKNTCRRLVGRHFDVTGHDVMEHGPV